MGQAKREPPEVWVTGAEGLLGRAMLSWLKRESIPFVSTSSEVDIASPGALDHFLGSLDHTPSVVWNCAAMTGFERCEKDPERAFEVNGKGPCFLGQLGNKYGFRVVHFSSDAVFEGARGFRAEGSPLSPVSVYGRSKAEGERRLLDVQPQALIVRSSRLFGHHRLNFVLRVLHTMSEQKTIHVAAHNAGQPTSVTDLIRSSWALQHESGIWHVTNAGSASWYTLAQELHQLAQSMGLPIMCEEVLPVECNQVPTLTERGEQGLLDTDKAERHGLQLRTWQEALKEVLEDLCSPLNPTGIFRL
jgi:dTDP-4-dehydrorhamnose reductase